MKHSKIYGIALIIGTLGGIITMLFHPTGNDLLNQPDEIARRNELITTAAHSLAIFSLPLLFFGFLGFSRRLGLENPFNLAGLIAYGFGTIAVLNAAVINGLVAPTLTRKIIGADEPTQNLLRLILTSNFSLNQAFTKVFVVATAIALISWSICLLKKGRMMKATAIIGFAVGIFGILGILTGHLRLNVHGFGLFMFVQSIWTILIAVFMLRPEDKKPEM